MQYSVENISDTFGKNIILKIQRFITEDRVALSRDVHKIYGTVNDHGVSFSCHISPCLIDNRVDFSMHGCTCEKTLCIHAAATAFAALAKYPDLKPPLRPGPIGKAPQKRRQPPPKRHPDMPSAEGNTSADYKPVITNQKHSTKPSNQQSFFRAVLCRLASVIRVLFGTSPRL